MFQTQSESEPCRWVSSAKMANAVTRVVLRCEEAQENESLGKLHKFCESDCSRFHFLKIQQEDYKLLITLIRGESVAVRLPCVFVTRLALVRDLDVAGITKTRLDWPLIPKTFSLYNCNFLLASHFRDYDIQQCPDLQNDNFYDKFMSLDRTVR